MTDLRMARVWTVDPAARAALVELDGSEGTAVWAMLADAVHLHALGRGAECLVARTPGGERTLLGTLGHDPARLGLPGAGSAAAPPTSFAYTDGVTWQNALSAGVTTLAACDLWISAWLSLRCSATGAAGVVDLRAIVDGGAAGQAMTWGASAASLQQVCAFTARLAVPGAGAWTVRLQARLKVSGSTAACDGGLLLAEPRIS